MEKSRRRSPLEIKVTETHMCSVDLRLKILAKVPFFQNLPAEALVEINRLFREIGFDSGGYICLAGDPAERLFVVADGRVKLLRHSLAGRDILLDLLAAGEFFGSLSMGAQDVYPDTAQAQTAACILAIGRESFQQILERYPQVALSVIEIMASRLQAANERVQQLTVMPVEGRIASVLLMLSRKFGKPHTVGRLIEVPLSRDDLASLAGTTGESASRVMSQMQKDGLIASGRQWVAVNDQAGLEALARAEVP